LFLATCGRIGDAPSAPISAPQKFVTPKLTVVNENGEPIGGALLTVSDAKTGTRIAELHSDERGEFAVRGPQIVAITATSPAGESWAFEPHFSLQPPGELRMRSSDCEPFAGMLRTNEMPATFNVARVSDQVGDSFAIAVAQDGRFHACLPPGTYGGDLAPNVRAPRLFAQTPVTDIDLPIASRTTLEKDATSLTGILGETSNEFVTGIPAAVELFAIGESNHGTREFITERTQLTIALANRRDVRLVMIEAGFAEVIPLDEYINGATIDIKAAVVNLGYWTWDTKTFLGALDDLREANRKRSPKDRMHIVGFDMQDTEAAIPQLVNARAIDTAVVPSLERLVEKDGVAWKKMDDAERAPIMTALTSAAARRDDRGIASPVNRVALAAHQLVLRFHALESSNGWALLATRDRGMAELALDILSRSTVPRAALWAHVGHLSRSYVIGAPPMGNLIARQLGARYEVFALLAASGSARAWDAAQTIGVVPRDLPKPPPFCLEAMLGAHGIAPITYFRFATATEPALSWLTGLHPLRDFGAVHPKPEQEFHAFDLSGLDGAILFEEVHPTEPTATGERRK
jgi:erythromycin esterase